MPAGHSGSTVVANGFANEMAICVIVIVAVPRFENVVSSLTGFAAKFRERMF